MSYAEGTNTPRTDALLDMFGMSDARSGDAGALRDFARQLERERNELLAACEAALNDRMFKEWPEVATLLINAIKHARGET